MGEILLCPRPIRAIDLQSQSGISIDQIASITSRNPSILAANTPHVLGNVPSVFDLRIARRLSPVSVSQELTKLSLSYGGDNVIAMADITKNLLSSSTSVYTARAGGFTGAVSNYQNALLKYRQAVTSNSKFSAAAKKTAHAAFDKMQHQFHNELKVVTAGIKSRRGTPLTSAERGTNIARSSRNVAKLILLSRYKPTIWLSSQNMQSF